MDRVEYISPGLGNAGHGDDSCLDICRRAWLRTEVEENSAAIITLGAMWV